MKMTVFRKARTIFVLSLFTIILYYLSTKAISEINLRSKSSKKTILLYHTLWWGTEICNQFQTCSTKNCIITSNTTLLPIEDFDAIIFHEPTRGSNPEMPKKRNTFQKYIFFSHESPITHPMVYSEGFYNWTITYRNDSDIFFPYGQTLRRNSDDLHLNINKLVNKTKLVAWVVSNCHMGGVKYRMDYVKELQKHIQVDVYGKCGNLSCPGRMSNECYEMLDANYKFYLSFENSLCKDYITEKTFNILKYTHMVPVVLGFADYDYYVPAKSVINAEDFDSPKQMADYLIHLSNNINEYKTYFEWKKNYIIESYDLENMCCKLCRKLHEPLQYSTYENLAKWSIGKDKSLCHKKHFV